MDPSDPTWLIIERQRRSVADLLTNLEPHQWEQSSLCQGWRVRDVAAHLVLGAQPLSVRRMVTGVIRAGGDFDSLNHDMAVAFAERPVTELVEQLRRRAGSREKPFVTQAPNLLFDVLVHAQDIAVPVGIGVPVPPDDAGLALANLWRMGWPWRTPRRFQGLRFDAEDTDWSAGEGREVRGPALSLLLALTGRPAAIGELSGDGVVDLTERIGGRPKLGFATAPERGQPVAP